MIKIFTKHLDDAIKELEWVERYGGLVTTLNTRIEVADNVFKTKSFPAALNKFSCDDITKACFETGDYVDMYPNTAYKSVVYLEDRTGLQFVRTTGSKARISEYTANLRLVCWGNGHLLNFEGCNLNERMSMDLFRKSILKITKKSLLPQGVLRLTISPQGTEEQSVTKIFDRYTYQDEMPFLQPHEYFALKLKLDVRLITECLPILNTIDPEVCQ